MSSIITVSLQVHPTARTLNKYQRLPQTAKSSPWKEKKGKKRLAGNLLGWGGEGKQSDGSLLDSPELGSRGGVKMKITCGRSSQIPNLLKGVGRSGGGGGWG